MHEHPRAEMVNHKTPKCCEWILTHHTTGDTIFSEQRKLYNAVALTQELPQTIGFGIVGDEQPTKVRIKESKISRLRRY